jgi:hypothetical protein
VLTRRLVGLFASAVIAAGAILTWGSQPAAAGGPVVCPPTTTTCFVQATSPPAPGTSAGSGHHAQPAGSGQCQISWTGEIVPCHDSMFGWFNAADGCYYHVLQPQPAPADSTWEGHYPNGAVYQQTCPGIIGTGGGWVWLATPPPGYGGPAMTPAQLAQQAVRELNLRGPDIGMAPPPGGTGTVGVPVWLWTAVAPTTWGPVSATATVPGLSVTATASADHIAWDMGDGHAVTCPNPGTPYQQSLGAKPSPTCGYQYSTSSAGQPQAKYAVTATTTWNVTWAGGGQTGQLTVTRSSTTHVGIGELQVLVS